MNDSNTPESRRRQAVLMALARHPSRPEVAARLEAMIFTGRLTGDALLSGYLPASIALQESFQSEDVRYLSAMARLIDRVAAELANPSTLEPPKPVTPPAEVVPAPDAIQSEPVPAVVLKPTKKPGDDWTPADYAELLRQYESLTTGKGAMKGESAREALGKAWSYAPNSIKPFLTTARKQRTPTT